LTRGKDVADAVLTPARVLVVTFTSVNVSEFLRHVNT